MPNYTLEWTEFCVIAFHVNSAEGTQMQSGAGNSIIAYGQKVHQA